MELSRRDLAVAGVLAPGHVPGRAGPRRGGDEAAVKKAVEEMRTAYLERTRPSSRR